MPTAYVAAIKPKWNPGDRFAGHDVFYNERPSLRFGERAAEVHCEALAGMGVRVGTHFCNFAVAEVARGEYAIVCESHPRSPRAVK